METLFQQVSGDEMMSVKTLLVQLCWATGLGALIAWRPLSRLVGAQGSKMEIAYALLLMTVAASFVIVVIGDSLARAFGIVGLGSFVRFRSSIKDPSDVVLFFVAIGVGMACGLGHQLLAVIAVAALSILLMLRDRAYAKRPPQPVVERSPSRVYRPPTRASVPSMLP